MVKGAGAWSTSCYGLVEYAQIKVQKPELEKQVKILGWDINLQCAKTRYKLKRGISDF